MKSIINKVVFGIVWLIVHIIFLTLLIIFTIHQIMTEQPPEWIQVLFVCSCAAIVSTAIPIMYLRDWLDKLHGGK